MKLGAMNYTLEICTTSVESSVIAQQHGAQRLELCDNLFEGGTTPSAGMIKSVRERVNIDLFVLIRPRGSDFYYTEEEFEVMKNDILMAKDLGVDGIVSGVLTSEGAVDVIRTRELVELSGALPFTFHRAIDCVENYEEAISKVIDTGADRILTSGQQSSAAIGAEIIGQAIEKFGDRIKIMPGGGIKSGNIIEVARRSGAHEFHMTAKKWVQSEVKYKPQVSMNSLQGIPEYERIVTSGAEIDQVKALLQEI